MDFLEELKAPTDDEDEPEPILSSYLQGWHLFVLFALCYFSRYMQARRAGLSIIILILLFVISTIYVFAMRLFYFLVDRREEFLFMARGLLFDEQLETALRLQGYLMQAWRPEDGRYRWRTVSYRGQKHHYYVFWIKGEFSLQVMDEFLKVKMPASDYLLLVTNGVPGPGVAERIEALQCRLTIVVIPTAEDIPALMKTVFGSGAFTSYLI